MQNWFKTTWRDLLLAAFVGLMIFIPRSRDLDRYVTIDEPAWLVYAGNFYYALGQRDWPGTYQREHPAVTLSWIGAAGFLVEFPEYRGLGQGQFDSFKKASLFYRDNDVPPIDLIATSRFVLVVVNTLVLTLTFWILKRLVGRWPALLGFTLLAFSPFQIAHIQIFHTDALMGSFMFLALSAFLAYVLLGKSRSDLTIAALTTGLAWLTKAPSAILLPIFGLILLLHEGGKLRNSQQGPTVTWAWNELVKPLSAIVLLAGLVFIAFFPAMWADPIGTLSQMFSKVGFYSESGGTGLRIFFNGEIVTHERPSLFFYPIVYLWRSTPVTLIGVLLSGLFLFPLFHQNSNKNTARTIAFIWLYLLIFTIWLTLPARMFDRYFHPFFGPAAFIAGVSWYALFKWLRTQSHMLVSRYVSYGLVLVIVTLQLLSVIRVFPYYLSYYSQLLGGQDKAQDVMMIGWGDGLNLAADYLREQPNPEDMRILTWYGTGSFSYFWFTENGVTTLDTTWSAEYSTEYQNTDYAIIYVQQIQRDAPKTLLNFLAQHQPEHTISINGLEYIWIYNLRELPVPEFVSQ